jgi:hypothetical protein
MRWKVLAVGIGLALVVVLGLRAFRRGGVEEPVERPAPSALRDETPPADEVDEPTEQPGSSPAEDAAPVETSVQERVHAITEKMSVVIAAHDYERYVDTLVRAGLARADSEATVREFLNGVAACSFGAARQYYAEQGTSFDEFLALSEGVWSKNPSPDQCVGLDVRSTAQVALPCVAEVSQRYGVPLPR